MLSRCPIYDDGLCSGCNGKKCEHWEECITQCPDVCQSRPDPLDIEAKWIIAVPLMLALMFFAFLVMVI